MTPSPMDFWSVVDKGGTVGVLIVIIVAFARRWIVPSYVADDLQRQLDRMREERDQWQAIATRGLGMVEQLAASMPNLRSVRGGPP